MAGDVDPFDFEMAQALHLDIDVVLAWPNPKNVHWRAYFAWSNMQQKLAAKKPRS